jgi:putative mRNA 3-end processing factor
MPADDLVSLRPQGLYCAAGDFYIDPWRAVHRAVITHAHADHARAGHSHVLATALSEGVLRARLGAVPLQGLRYGEAVLVGGVLVSLHPAGHVLGSAQVRLAHQGRVWVVTGDYYLSGIDETNPTCQAFEPVACDVFVTESTFALPVYRWRPQQEVLADINAWWQGNAERGRASWLKAYSFGKAQRLLAGIDAATGPLIVHPAVAAINAAYAAAGVELPACRVLDADVAAQAAARRALVIAPPLARGHEAFAGLAGADIAFASGWMHLAGTRASRGGQGFALSDHADWPGLLRAVRASGAQRILVMHGHEAALVHWLRMQGLQAGSFDTAFARDGGPGE